MHDDKTTRYVIKRVKKMHAKHHGGSWKIAYADFITAMMAFFLLMWLLSLLNKYQLQGISNYFKKPLKEAFTHQDNISHPAVKPTPIITGAPSSKNLQSNASPKESPKPNDASNETTAEQMKEELEASLAKDPQMAEYKNLLNFVVTNDGLKIELRDLENKPMFTQGKTDFQVYANKILGWLGDALNNYPNRVMIVGHTDSLAYHGGDAYSNWELSADRANATRRALVKAGMNSQKVIRIVGVADNELLDKTNTSDASNRRIEVIVLSADAAKKIREE